MTSINLQRGQRMKLSGISPQKQFIVGLNLGSSALTLDISCFGLDKDGKLSDDRYFVFYNQKIAPREAIKMLGKQSGDSECFWVDLASLPSTIQRLVFVISIDGVGDLKALGDSYLRFLVGRAPNNRWQEGAKFSFSGREFTSERALMVAEVYLKDEWRYAAIGQGFASGLDAVLKHFGGEVVEEASQAAHRPFNPPQPVRNAPPPVVPPQQPAKPAINPATVKEIRHMFGMMAASGSLTAFGWKQMGDYASSQNVTKAQIQEIIATDAARFLQNVIRISAADGVITAQEDADWERALRMLALPAYITHPLRQQWVREKHLSDIRQGSLPSVSTNLQLESDEICHYEATAQHLKVTAKWEEVDLVATSKKLYVITPDAGGKEISYGKFLQILPREDSIDFRLSVKSGA
ncbi:MAG: hypothetical protein EOP09_15100, partial [Proteobacteria bacterium]